MKEGPPFRAEHVGSFLRPPEVLAARERHAAGEIDAGTLREVEDRAIADLVRQEEEVGLLGITDGELRRTYFHIDFLEQLDGVNTSYGEFFARFQRDDGSEVGFSPPTMHVDAPIRHSRPIQGRDFDFLAGHVTKTPKVSVPAPSMLHFRGGREAISSEIYPDLEDFFTDLTDAYRAEIADLGSRGLTYLQMDDTNLAYLCDPDIRERTAARGDDPDDLTRLYCRLVNDAIRDRPPGMTVGVHLCRGNFQSAWVARGGYEPVAEILFQQMNVDAFFLEYDDERSGDFAPLRFMPSDKTVVLGLMSSKHPEVEDADVVKQRIAEAAKFVDLDQCSLSHQCGFSSTVHGNTIEIDDQWRKLARTVEIAQDVWAV